MMRLLAKQDSVGSVDVSSQTMSGIFQHSFSSGVSFWQAHARLVLIRGSLDANLI